MATIYYTDPLFEEMLAQIPKDEMRASDISFEIVVRILDILDHRGWNKADFARALGKKESEISKWLSGQHNFTIQTIAKIETVLGEDIISIKKYRKSSKGYKINTQGKKIWLNEPSENKYQR